MNVLHVLCAESHPKAKKYIRGWTQVERKNILQLLFSLCIVKLILIVGMEMVTSIFIYLYIYNYLYF